MDSIAQRIRLLETLLRDGRELMREVADVPPFPIGQAHYDWALEYSRELYPGLPPEWDDVLMEFLRPFWGTTPTDEFSKGDPAEYLRITVADLAYKYWKYAFQHHDAASWLEDLYCGGAISAIIQGLLPPELKWNEWLVLALTEQVYDFLVRQGINPDIKSMDEARRIVKEALAYVLVPYVGGESPQISDNYLTEVAERLVRLVGANLESLASNVIDSTIRKILYRVIVDFQSEDHPDLESAAKRWTEHYLTTLAQGAASGAELSLSGPDIAALSPPIETAQAVYNAHIDELRQRAEKYVTDKAAVLMGPGEPGFTPPSW